MSQEENLIDQVLEAYNWTPRQLAEKLGYKYQSFRNMRYNKGPTKAIQAHLKTLLEYAKSGAISTP